MSRIKEEKKLGKLYVSDYLVSHYKGVYPQLKNALKDTYGESAVGIIRGCKDSWVRDFMPFNTADGKLLSFDYDPDYLHKTHDEKYLTNQKSLLEEFGLESSDLVIEYHEQGVTKTRKLVLDGGNMVNCGDRIIICDKILKENKNLLSREEMARQLKAQLDAEIVFVPWDEEDEAFGHADGYAAWLGGNRVLMTNCREYNSDYAEKLFNALRDGGFDVTELELKNKSDNDWVYINYVRYRDLILMPALDLKGDDEAKRIIAEANDVPEKNVKKIKLTRSFVKWGGALHCCTWNSDVEL